MPITESGSSPDDKYLTIKIAKRKPPVPGYWKRRSRVMDDLSYTEAEMAFSPDMLLAATTYQRQGVRHSAMEYPSPKPAFKVFR